MGLTIATRMRLRPTTKRLVIKTIRQSLLLLAWLLVWGSLSSSFAQLIPTSFGAESNISLAVGSRPGAVAIGDFNGDGRPDLATANVGDISPNPSVPGVSIFLQNANGTFSAAAGSPIAAPGSPRSVAVGDVNGDGKLDLAVAGFNSASLVDVSIFLGNGDGTFQAQIVVPVVVSAAVVNALLGDFNRDGKLDLVVLGSSGVENQVSILLGNGNGTFGAAQNFGTGAPFTGGMHAIGDFNGDGKLDVAVPHTNANNVAILLGDGNGNLGEPSLFAVGGVAPVSVAVGDIDKDGILDLVTGDVGDGSISVLFGNGDGTFQPASNFLVGANSYSVAIGDLNGDGTLDIGVVNGQILLGDGLGNFASGSTFPLTVAGQGPMAIADLNRDGRADLVLVTTNANKVSTFLNTTTFDPSGSFGPPNNFAVATTPFSVAVGDFNGDGKKDLAVASLTHNVSVLVGDGSGSFGAATNLAVLNSPISVAVRDFNGDGKQDLAVATGIGVSILLGNGSGGFAVPTNFPAGTNPRSVVAGDFNGDGKQDLAVVNQGGNNVSILLGDGSGGFGAATNFAVGTTPNLLTAGDFNGDGKLDLAVANLNGNDVSILLGDGSGGFGAATNITVGSLPNSVAVGDFDGDGKQDLAVANQGSNNVSILLGNGSGGFGAPNNVTVGISPRAVSVGDFNGDGKHDVAVANLNSNNVSILLGSGSGGFNAPINFGVGSLPESVAIGDLNGDGKPDLAVANSFTANVSILLNGRPPAPAIVTTSIPNAASGTSYNVQLVANSSFGPITWTVVGGFLPAGMNLSSAGVLSGTPTVPGISGFTVRATDATGVFSDQTFFIVVESGVSVPAAPGLISWWPGNGNSSDIKSGNNGALQNGAGFAAGKVGQGFIFDGVDDYVSVPVTPNLGMTSAYTFEGWVKFDETTFASFRPLAVRGATNANDIDIYGQLASQNICVAHNRGNGGTVSTHCFVPPPLGTLFHLAVTWDGIIMQAYYNGVPQVTGVGGATPPTAPLYTAKPWSFGRVDHASFGGVAVHKGLLDEISLYDRALSMVEIQSIVVAGSGGKTLVVDVTPPLTSITGVPPPVSNFSSATFVFTSNEPGSTFECSLDGAVFTACTSPVTYVELANGSHNFRVRAIDAAGNSDPEPDFYSWIVNTSLPSTPTTSGLPDTWSLTGSPVVNRRLARGSPLPDGRFLVVGGTDTTGVDSSASVFYSSAEIYDPLTGQHTATGSLTTGGRVLHTLTRLANGKILVTGGWNGTSSLSTAELYDPVTGVFTQTGSMNAARSQHSAERLDNGKVLITGGWDGGPLASAELYDPATGQFTLLAASLSQARNTHTATLLATGKVLIAGGYGVSAPLASAELFDPVNNTFATTGSLSQARGSHKEVILPNGDVLIVGGNGGSSALSSAEIYNSNTGSFAAAAPLNQARQWHGLVLMPNGKVLVAGGNNNTSGHWDVQTNFLNSAEIYDPILNEFSLTASMTVARVFQGNTIVLWSGKVLASGLGTAELFCPDMPGIPGTWAPTANGLTTPRQSFQATQLDNGKVLSTGGTDTAGNPFNSAELYDYVTNTFAPTGNLTIARRDHRDVRISTGQILVTGGRSAATSNTLNSTELYDPVAGTFSSGPSMGTFRRIHRLVTLNDGRVLMTGGRGGGLTTSNGILNSAQIYDPATNAFTATGNMALARTNHRTTRLPDGRVLVTGGTGAAGVLASAEIFDPAGNGGIGTFTLLSVSMSVPRDGHTSSLLPNGKVLLIAGNDADGNPLASAEIFDPATQIFSPAGSLNINRDSQRTSGLDNGRILIAGGRTSTTTASATNSAELYDFVTGTSDLTGSMSTPRTNFVTIGLRNGLTLAWGGVNSAGVLQSSGELYSTPICNSPPFCSPDFYVTTQDVPLVVAGPGVLANDSDLDLNPLSAVLVDAPLPAQGSVTLNANGGFTFTPAPGFTGVATFTYRASDGQTFGNLATVSVQVNAAGGPLADLNVAQTANPPSGVSAAGTITYDVTVTNSGPSPASGVVLTDILPTEVFFVSATPSQGGCNPVGGTVSCALGNIASDNSATVSVVIYPFTAGTKTNTATVLANENDSNLANNLSSVTTTIGSVAVADLRVNLSASPDPVVLGAPLTYQVTATNLGSGNVPSAVVSNSLPSQVSFVSATPSQGTCNQSGGIVSCDFGALANGASATVGIVVIPTVVGAVTNVVTVSGDIPASPSQLTNNAASATTQIILPNIGDVNDAPVAVQDFYATNQNVPINTALAGLPGVIGNDLDADTPKASLTASLVLGSAGNLVLNPNGSFVYTPPLNYIGSDAFNYQISDGTSFSNVQTVFISVVPTGQNVSADTDGDGVPDAVDSCPASVDPGQDDQDGDGIGDICDQDVDGDGVDDKVLLAGILVPKAVAQGGDNCPRISNPFQADFDGDGIGDECDPDADGDGFGNASPGSNQNVAATPDSNTVYDGRTGNPIGPYTGTLLAGQIRGGDCDDATAAIVPGTEGCGQSVPVALAPKTSSTQTIADSDSDGLSDSQEVSLGTNPNNRDSDGDGILDGADNCKLTPNTDQKNTDGDSLGDACDPDADNDGILDKTAGPIVDFVQLFTPIAGGDNCPLVPNPDQKQSGSSLLGDACNLDIDGDGFGNIAKTPSANTIYDGLTGAVIGAFNGSLLPGQIRGGDCSDLNAAVNPGRAEIPGNGIDDDCNPNTPDAPFSIRFQAAGGENLDTWLPTDGAALNVGASVIDSTGIGISPQPAISFTLLKVTNLPGKYTNDPSTDISRDFNYSIGANSVALTSLDYGGSISFRVSATVNGTVITRDLTLPRDDNGNGIADVWEAPFGGNLIVSDDKDVSVGNTYNGDGLSVLAEYRGFIWGPQLMPVQQIGPAINGLQYQTAAWVPQGQAAHFRTNPTRKDVFVKYSGFNAVNPFALGNALNAAGIDVHVVDLGATPTPAEQNIDALLISNANAAYGLEDGRINKRGVRDWSWDTKGSSGVGTATAYGTATLYQKALDSYMNDKAYRDGGVSSPANGKLDLLSGVEDGNDNGVGPETIKGNSEDKIVVNSLLDNDAYLPGSFIQALSTFDVDKNGFVEMPITADPNNINRAFEYTRAHVVKHTVTHEITHALGSGHDKDSTSLMYELTNNWSRDGNLSSLAKSQLVVHNR